MNDDTKAGSQGRGLAHDFHCTHNPCTCSTTNARDELLRALLALVIGDVALFPGVHPGHALGSLNADQATEFANYVDVFNGPGLAAYIDDDGIFRLKVMAA